MEDAFVSFLETEYYTILQGVLKERITLFVPKYPPEIGNVAAQVVEQRRKWISMLTAGSAEAIETELRARWEETLRTSPACLRSCMDNAENYAIFERDAYYESVAHVADVAQSGLTWTYRPLITPETADEKAAIAGVTENLSLIHI